MTPLRRLPIAAALLSVAAPAPAGETLYATEGNRMLRLALDVGVGAPPQVFIERAGPAGGRDVNGMVCPLPDGSGRFIVGEDTGQPDTPPGWGVFAADGVQIGKLTATYRAELGDPHGCAFAYVETVRGLGALQRSGANEKNGRTDCNS